MPNNDAKIKSYDEPAGGRGAVKSALNAFKQQGIPFKAVVSLVSANKVDQFDCPGCAFPDKTQGSLVDSCEQGQKAIAWEMTRKPVGAGFFADKSLADLRAMSDFDLEFQGRLTTPMVFKQGQSGYQPITWSDAFGLIAEELRAISPNEAAFYASGRSSNEAAFLWQLLARSYGCQNLPDSSNFCHEPSGFALKDAIGVSKGTCSIDDFEQADLIMVIGQNPATNHPRMMGALHAAAKRGAKVVAINPLKERGFVDFSDPKELGEMITNTGIQVAQHIYQVKIGGDLALFKGVIKHVLELDALALRQGKPSLLDHDFIDAHTEGFAALVADVQAESWDTIVQESGLPQAEIESLARLYVDAKATMATWCMGVTHHENSVATVQMIVNLLLLKGNVGKPGAGAIPVRGHSNVQGDRTMGATSKVSDRFLDNLEAVFPAPTVQARLGRQAGLDASGVIDELLAGRLGALLTLGGNFGVAAPDSDRVLQALSQTRLTVHIATKLNRTHCYPGQVGLILPSLGRTDVDKRAGQTQFVTLEDAMSNIRTSRGIQNPLAAEMMSEPALVAGLGQALVADRDVPWQAMANDYDLIREFIERCQAGVVDGFEDFNRKASEQGRFRLVNHAANRVWKTASGKAGFRAHPIDQNGPVHRARARHGDEVLALMTVRSHDQFNTTVYGMDDRYRGVFGGRQVVFMNQLDLAARGLKQGDLVDLVGCGDDGVARQVYGFKVVSYDIPFGCAAAYFPEATPLVPASLVSRHTRTPAYKEIPVLVSKSAD